MELLLKEINMILMVSAYELSKCVRAYEFVGYVDLLTFLLIITFSRHINNTPRSSIT